MSKRKIVKISHRKERCCVVQEEDPELKDCIEDCQELRHAQTLTDAQTQKLPVLRHKKHLL